MIYDVFTCTSKDIFVLDIGEGIVGFRSEDVIQEQILRLGLKVDISWVRDHLHEYIYNETKKNRPVLFFDWVPNTLSSTGNYTRIKFPWCRPAEGQNPVNCDFEVNQMSKMIWPKVETNAPEAYHVISHMSFSQEEYVKLMQKFVDRLDNKLHNVNYNDYHKTACEWVKENQHIWEKWMPKDLTNKTKIYIGGLFNRNYPAIALGIWIFF